MADSHPQLQFGLGSIQIGPLEASQLSSEDMISKGCLGNLGMKGLTILVGEPRSQIECRIRVPHVILVILSGNTMVLSSIFLRVPYDVCNEHRKKQWSQYFPLFYSIYEWHSWY